MGSSSEMYNKYPSTDFGKRETILCFIVLSQLHRKYSLGWKDAVKNTYVGNHVKRRYRGRYFKHLPRETGEEPDRLYAGE
jgi:hypothetical protein